MSEENEMKLSSFAGLLNPLRSPIGIRFLAVLTALLSGTISGAMATEQEDTYRTIVAELVTGEIGTLEEDQVLRLGHNLVFRISLYRENSEGELIPNRVRSLSNLEIHLQDGYWKWRT